jgi:hypothetical protein
MSDLVTPSERLDGRLDGARAMRIGTYTGESRRPVLDLRHRALPRNTCG